MTLHQGLGMLEVDHFSDEELDLKLHTLVIILQTANAGLNVHIFRGVLNGLVYANPEEFGRYSPVPNKRPPPTSDFC